MHSITRRLVLAGSVAGSFAATLGPSEAEGTQLDTSYAPQFRVGSGTDDVIEFVYSLTCPDCVNFYRSKVRDLLRQIAGGRSSTVIFHNLVRSPADLEFSTEVLLTNKYPEFCLSILDHNAASKKIMSSNDMLRLRETLGFGLRENADQARAKYSLALLNKYALEKLAIRQTPTIFRNKVRVSRL